MIISLREFQLKPTKYLGDLPVTLTTYGKPVAKIVSVNTNTDVLTDNDKVLTEKKSVNRKVLTEDKNVLTESGSPTKSVNTKKEALRKVEKEVREMEDNFGISRAVPKPPPMKKKKMGYKSRK